jgi:hypothetical protein
MGTGRRWGSYAFAAVVLTGCSAVQDEGNGDDEIAPTETNAASVSVTSTPGKAIWTKVWRSQSSTAPIYASAVAADRNGDAFLLRGHGQTLDEKGIAVTDVDVTRYAADGSMRYRVAFPAGLLPIKPPTLKIASSAGRTSFIATHLDTTSGDQWSDVSILDSETGARVRTVRIFGLSALMAVSIDRLGHTVVAGTVRGDVEIGGVRLVDPDPDMGDGFVAKLDRTGNVLFAKRFEGRLAESVGVDDDAHVYVTGPSTFDPSKERQPRPTIAKLSSTGAYLRSTSLLTTDGATVRALAVSGGGRVAIAGTFQGTLQIGDVTLVQREVQPAKWTEPFVAKLDPEGDVQFARSFPGEGRRAIGGLALDSYGQVVVAIGYGTRLDVDDRSLTTSSLDAWETALIKLAAVDGRTVWFRGYEALGASPPKLDASSLAVSASGRLLVTGMFQRDADFGRGPIAGSPTGTAFLARLYQ